jgi:hypothetical protein
VKIITNKIRKFEYTDVLGWSYTRFSNFNSCKRKYYYEYYRKWDTSNIVLINTLRNLTTVPLEIGNISHKLIYKILRRLQLKSEKIDHPTFFDYAYKEAFRIFEQKEFEDVYYKLRENVDFENEIYPLVRKSLENFLNSDRFQWILEEALIYKENWYLPSEEDEEKDFGECRINNMKAYCKVDFMFPIEEELHILDWKTGKKDYKKHYIQMNGYVGWANFHFKTNLELIKPNIAYLLPNYSEESVDIKEFDLDVFIARIRRETDEMYEYCEIPETNTPIEKERFPMISNLSVCRHCKYRQLCGRN